MRTGKPILSKASGKETLKQDAKLISPTSIFRLASCTKLIANVAILRFVSQGHASLDDPSIIEKHLPELCKQEILTSYNEPFTTKPRTKPITLRHLLAHTSGLSLDLMDPLLSWRKSRGEESCAVAGPVPDCYETPMLFEPGEGWTYGAGQDWAAVLIERLTGKKFSEWLKENVCDIIGIDNRIGFYKDELEKSTGQEVVTVTIRGEDKKLKEQVMPQFKGEAAGGGLMCSVENFVKILQDLVSPDPKLLSPDLLNELFKPQLEPSSAAHKALVAGVPVFSAMTGPLTAGLDPSTINHGLGGVITTTDSGLGKSASTLCWGGAFNWIWWANREVGIAGVFACGMYPPAQKESMELMELYVKEVWKMAGLSAK